MWACVVAGVVGGLMQEDWAAATADQDQADHDAAMWRHMESRTPSVQHSSKSYSCVGCGAPLFGVMNENCQYCRRPSQS